MPHAAEYNTNQATRKIMEMNYAHSGKSPAPAFCRRGIVSVLIELATAAIYTG
jgi:hypothetical protein